MPAQRKLAARANQVAPETNHAFAAWPKPNCGRTSGVSAQEMGGLATWAKIALAKAGKLAMGAACEGAAWGRLRLAQAPSGE